LTSGKRILLNNASGGIQIF